MTIILDTPMVDEVLEYKYIFMTGMKIEQEPTNDSTLPPKYIVNIRYKLYAIDSLGNRNFKKKNYSIKIPNYLETATAQSDLGDTRMIDALINIEIALSKIINDKAILGNTGIM